LEDRLPDLELPSAAFEAAIAKHSEPAQAAALRTRAETLASRLVNFPGVECETLAGEMAAEITELLSDHDEWIVRDAVDLLDRFYHRGVKANAKTLDPSLPELPETSSMFWDKLDKGLFAGRLVAQVRSGPLVINAFRFDPKRFTVSAVDCSKEPAADRNLATLCRSAGAVCGTSGGFSLLCEPGIEPPVHPGDPVGLLMSNHRVLSPPIFPRSALFFDDNGQVFTRQLGMKGCSLAVGKARFPVRKVDAPLRTGEIAIYTPLNGKSSPKAGRLHIAVAGSHVLQVSESSVPIPVNGFVVSIDPGPAGLGYFDSIREGDPVEVILPPIPGAGTIVSALAGGPSLLDDRGRPHVDLESEAFTGEVAPGPFFPGSAAHKAPLSRLAWGIRPSFEILAVAVDGRDPGRSVGLSLNAMARLMAKLGCNRAINLDGGASKRMVILDRRVDRTGGPFEAGESNNSTDRLLSSALLVVPRGKGTD
jgi:Phosphodiester glycosidase